MELKTVKMVLAVVMLCSGLVHFTFANRLRIFSLCAMTNISWENSLEFCRNKNESLVTLYDEGDINFMFSFIITNNFGNGDGEYIGLHWSNQNVTWSDGTPFKFNLSTVNVANGKLVCEGIDNDEWRGFNCSDRMYFMCYKDDDYHLIKTKKTWCQAQLHCRTDYTDLVSITNGEQNKKVIQEGQNETFWIGLMHDDWEWADKGCSTYRSHLDSGDRQKCTYIGEGPKITQNDCTRIINAQSVICSKGTERIVAINEGKTWEEAFDYCEENYSSLLQIEDEEDQAAVNQWLNYTTSDNDSDLFWIALRQSRVFGFWIWRDRTVSNNNWKDRQIPEMPLSNNCGAINRTDFTWRDENCLHKLPFLCEEKISFS